MEHSEESPICPHSYETLPSTAPHLHPLGSRHKIGEGIAWWEGTKTGDHIGQENGDQFEESDPRRDETVLWFCESGVRCDGVYTVHGSQNTA